ncbi:MAG: hypothetical protein DSM106950_26630 [Stigonema ocellatum SAG 48.90 = DSM 106950]|nr:hypothetical protein [Stigonema ocellatum SAG 48.90 = DSM 106950]
MSVVHLKDFSLLSPTIQSSDLLKAIELAIPAKAIEEAIVISKANEERNRALPAQLVVCLLLRNTSHRSFIWCNRSQELSRYREK